MRCTLIGCGPTFKLVTPLPVPFEAIRTLDAEVCRNELCVRDSLASITDPPGPYTGINVSFPKDAEAIEAGGGRAQVIIMGDAAGVPRLEVWYFSRRTDVRNGDTISVRLIDSAGQAVFSFEETPEFRESYPNGPQCGPRCIHATVDLR